MTARPTPSFQPTPALPHEPRLADRLWDALALLLVVGGVTLFVAARKALLSLGAGTYVVPAGVSAVTRADLHVAQTRLAMWTIGVGVLVGIAAAARHRFRRRDS